MVQAIFYKLFLIFILLHVAVGRNERSPCQRKMEKFRGVTLDHVPKDAFSSCLLPCQKERRGRRGPCRIGTKRCEQFSPQDSCYRCIEGCWFDKIYVSPKAEYV